MDIFDPLNSNFLENLCKCQINVNKSQINSIVNLINLNPVLTPRVSLKNLMKLNFISMDFHFINLKFIENQ
jgi:hypothetical protein